MWKKAWRQQVGRDFVVSDYAKKLWELYNAESLVDQKQHQNQKKPKNNNVDMYSFARWELENNVKT